MSASTSDGNAFEPIALDDTLGIVFIGTFLAIILYGLVLHQAYHYYVQYRRDKLWLKIYVAVVIFFETICAILTIHICYYYLVTNYFVPQTLLVVSWSSALLAIFGSITAAISQSFFVQRVWLLGTKFRYIVVLSVMFLLLEIAACFVAGAKAFESKTWTVFSHWTYLISIHGAASTVSDLLLTGVLIYTLHKSRTGIKRTDSMISTLILYAVSTSLITGVFNAICFITSVTLPSDLFYLAASIIGIRLYSNCLLAALNSRRSILERHSVQVAFVDNSPFGVSGLPLAATYQSKTLEMSGASVQSTSFCEVLDIKVTTEVTQDTPHDRARTDAV